MRSSRECLPSSKMFQYAISVGYTIIMCYSGLPTLGTNRIREVATFQGSKLEEGHYTDLKLRSADTVKGSSSPNGLSTPGVHGPAVTTSFLVLKFPLAVLIVITCPGIISVTGCSSRNTPPADTNSFCKDDST